MFDVAFKYHFTKQLNSTKKSNVQTGVLARKTGERGEGMRTPIQCKRLRCVQLHRHSPTYIFGAKIDRNLTALRKELISVALLGLVCWRYYWGVRTVDLKHLQSTDLCCEQLPEQKHSSSYNTLTVLWKRQESHPQSRT